MQLRPIVILERTHGPHQQSRTARPSKISGCPLQPIASSRRRRACSPAAEGMYYTDVDGKKDPRWHGGAVVRERGSWPPAHYRSRRAAVDARMDFAPTFQMGHPIAFEFAAKLAGEGRARRSRRRKLDRVFFTGSGSESVDTALKIAIAYQRSIGARHPHPA
jgi:adenosylmethionine-8-amino-7-oxononanoate aminotransferase